MEIERVYLLAKLIEKKLSRVLYSFFRYVPLSLSLPQRSRGMARVSAGAKVV